MDLGLRFHQTPVNQLSQAKPAIQGFDLFSLTAQICSSLNSNKVESVNRICTDLIDLPSLLETGLNKLNQINDNKMSNRSIAEAKSILESLKSIPIYEEVLSYKFNKKLNQNDEANSVSDNLLEKNILSSSQGSEFNKSGSACDSYFDKMTNASSICYNSSNTVSMNSHPDNSFPFADSSIQNEQEFANGRLTADSYANYANTPLKLKRVNQQLSTNQNQFYVPDLTKAFIPLGYIQLDNDKNYTKKTKVVTNCEHVDRKHYAKGLCSIILLLLKGKIL